MRIDLAFTKLPPALDGIGDHTARLAEVVAAAGARVRVLTAQEDAEAIPDVTVEHAFSMDRRRDVRALLPAVETDPPEWLVLQFNQFSWGRWGLNPYLPFVVQRIRQRCPTTRVAVLFHEDFVPVISWRFAIMTLWQRAQFWALGRSADLAFFSIEPWAQKYRSWFPKTSVYHMPVGSNMPRVGTAKEDARRPLGIAPDAFVAGVFGSAHASRMLDRIRAAADALYRRSESFVVLYIGPHGDTLREALEGLPLVDAGRLPAEEVSAGFAAMDVHLAPFVDGVSTRRGSFMAGIQHGVPTVSTDGPLTDPMLRAADGEAFLLAPVGDSEAFVRSVVELLEQAERRARVGDAGRALYDRAFAWDAVGDRLLAILRDAASTRGSFASSPAPSTLLSQ